MAAEPLKKNFQGSALTSEKKRYSGYVGNPSADSKTDINDSSQITYRIHRLDIWPVIRVASVIFTLIGLLVGFFAFLASPTTGEFSQLTLTTRLLSAVVFAFLYMLIITFGITLMIVIYNFLASSFSWGLRIHLKKQD